MFVCCGVCVCEFMYGAGVSCLSALKLCKHRYLNARGSNNKKDVCRLSGSSVEMMYKQKRAVNTCALTAALRPPSRSPLHL